MATAQQLATSAENLMSQLRDNSITFAEFVSSMQSIKTDYESQKVTLRESDDDNILQYEYKIARAITASLSDPEA
jgi:hypothetical protein